MDELEEILYEYRIGLRGLPSYEELQSFVNHYKGELDRVYDVGYEDGRNDG